MKTGFIGAGRVGCSIGKYLSESGVEISGYYDTAKELADSAAAFTSSKSFSSMEDLITQSGLIFLTTPDSLIQPVWEMIRLLPIAGKIICHCSGALPADALAGMEQTGACGCSLHPMLPFHDRFSSYQQLTRAFFTTEGQEPAVQAVTELFRGLGNTVCRIRSECKPSYHAAASILSNQVIAVLDAGYCLLEDCGFSREEARNATKELVRLNMENVLQQDCMAALTGPIERGDMLTVQKHLDCLPQDDQAMYRVLGARLVQIAAKKHPGFDYAALLNLLENS